MDNFNDTRLIPLTQGKFAIVDAEDYEWLSQYKWQYNSNTKYASTSSYVGKINGKHKYNTTFMHRLITNCPNGMQVDHINGERLDNTKSNLRICTLSQNRANINVSRGKSKYKGVSWDKANQKWYVTICINKKRINLGRFIAEDDAAKAYDNASKKYHKEFGKTNKDMHQYQSCSDR